MSYYVLTGKCTVISRTTVQRVTNLELQVDSNKLLYKEFDQEVRRILGEEEPQQDIGDKPSPADWAEFMEFDEDFQEELLGGCRLFSRSETELLLKTSRSIGFEPTGSAFVYLSQSLRQRDSTKPTVIRCGRTRFAKK